jgi:lipopolysaccharide export system permease protein
MQFLWKYIDDLVGKGLEIMVIAKLLFYAAARFVPMALPISVLLSSIMTFGNIAEKSELMAMKSAGVSLRRCMTPLFTLVIFNNELSGYSIKIDKKLENGTDLDGIMIYDHNSEKGNDKVIVAEKGKMYLAENEQYFVIALQNGYSYNELDLKKENKPFQRASFKEDILRFDLSDFGMKRSSEDLYRNHYAMMNNKQLLNAIDSIHHKTNLKSAAFIHQISEKNNVDFESLEVGYKSKLQNSQTYTTKVYSNAISSVKYLQSLLTSHMRDAKYSKEIAIKHEVEWHRKITLAIACIIFFLIGAPLGAIIRKGGFGMPVIISVGFFITYHIISVTSEKMVKEAEIAVMQGMWSANLILLPIGIYLIYKANSDSPLFSIPKFRFLKRR